MGKMLDLLEQRGELANTYIVFTTDNSTHMGEHRWFSWTGPRHPLRGVGERTHVREGPGDPGGNKER